MGDISLIANTGIQLVTRQIRINRDADRLLFHEWFDETRVEYNLELAYYLRQNQKTVRLYDLEDCRFVDNVTGELNVKENEVLCNPNVAY